MFLSRKFEVCKLIESWYQDVFARFNVQRKSGSYEHCTLAEVICRILEDKVVCAMTARQPKLVADSTVPC